MKTRTIWLSWVLVILEAGSAHAGLLDLATEQASKYAKAKAENAAFTVWHQIWQGILGFFIQPLGWTFVWMGLWIISLYLVELYYQERDWKKRGLVWVSMYVLTRALIWIFQWIGLTIPTMILVAGSLIYLAWQHRDWVQAFLGKRSWKSVISFKRKSRPIPLHEPAHQTGEAPAPLSSHFQECPHCHQMALGNNLCTFCGTHRVTPVAPAKKGSSRIKRLGQG